MKILHIVHWARSGIGVVVRDLVRHRSSDIEHVVVCLAPGKPTTDQIRDAGARVYEPAQAISWPASVSLLRKRIRLDQGDVVHSHSLTPRVIATLGATGIPHLTTIHTAYLYFQSPGIRNALKRGLECVAARRLSAPCVCVSYDVARCLPCTSMTSRAVVIANGIDLERARWAANEAHVELTGDPVLVAVGRLDWEKGFDRLLAAIAAVRSRFPGIRLVICGDGVERQALESQAQDLGLGAAVLFTGHVANPMPYFLAADAFVSSSVQEGFGLTAAEAMALGRPVIATPASGVGSALRDGETAIMASGFRPEDIADAIVRAFSDRERLRRVADAGRRFAETSLDVRRAVAAYERLYRDLVRPPTHAGKND